MDSYQWAAFLLAAAASPSCADPFAWGRNTSNELADGTNTERHSPVAVDLTGVLSGKHLTALAGGTQHTLALADDGKVYAWGSNWFGRLGNGSGSWSEPPVAVVMTGDLSGKKVIAVAAGYEHSLALADDGKVYAWGGNSEGELGIGSTMWSELPKAVDTSGALSGKTVTAIAAGQNVSFALTSDGRVFSWGRNNTGNLGTGTATAQETTPVAVDDAGVLSGKIVTAIAPGVALTSDGKLYAWGANGQGQLGDGTTDSPRLSPVAVDMTGALSGKTVTAVDEGICLTSEGKVYAWGDNSYGEVGDGTTSMRPSPVAVDDSGLLSGKTITAIASGLQNMALSSDGGLFAWGYNDSGQVGDGTNTERHTPVAVDTSGVLAGMAITHICAGVIFSVVLAEPRTTTFSLATARSYAANLGWLNWRHRPTATDAPAAGMNFLSGKIHAANAGWIDLGDGKPADGIGYRQTGGDLGVNHDGAGGLTGYAYGANIGWITFSQAWKSPPRIDLTTGFLSGFAYSANCGWIGLTGLKTNLSPGKDSDPAGSGTGDGIPDAWELEQLAANGKTADLSLLGATAESDADHDGASDHEEYLADSNPFSSASLPGAAAMSGGPEAGFTLEWPASSRRAYQLRYTDDLGTWDPVGALLTGTPQADGSVRGSVHVTPPATAWRMFFRIDPQLPLQDP